MKKLILSASVLMVLAAMSPAPIRDRRELRIEPEKSQSQRAAEQNLMYKGEVGSVPERTENFNAPSIQQESNVAAQTVAGANSSVDGKKSAQKASETVKAASKAMEAKKNEGPMRFVWAIFAIVAALGIFQAFRTWANKNLPDAPKGFNPKD
jgi:hypothetical protein